MNDEVDLKTAFYALCLPKPTATAASAIVISTEPTTAKVVAATLP